MRAVRFRSIVLGFALLLAGALHLALTEEHLSSSALLGLGFVLSGSAQLVLGAISLRSAARAPFRAIVILNGVLIVLYLAHVTVGLPLPDATDATEQGLIGAREAIELPAIVTKLVELLGIALAVWSQRDRDRDRALVTFGTRRAA